MSSGVWVIAANLEALQRGDYLATGATLAEVRDAIRDLPESTHRPPIAHFIPHPTDAP